MLFRSPAGVCLVIIRDDLVEKSADNLTTMLKYKTHVEKKSMFNTPPCFAIYIIKLVMEWIEKKGGIKALEVVNEEKAKVLYDLIDKSNLYIGTAEVKDRSKMNVTFRLSSEELQNKFLEEAGKEGFLGLKGHRSVGGCRASIYNAMPIEYVKKLVDFMEKFERDNK